MCYFTISNRLEQPVPTGDGKRVDGCPWKETENPFPVHIRVQIHLSPAGHIKQRTRGNRRCLSSVGARSPRVRE